MRKRLARALDKEREGKRLFVVNSAGPIDLTPAIDCLATSSARFGVVGLMPDLAIEDDPSEQASAPAQALSKQVSRST
jgi:hypothetical protein